MKRPHEWQRALKRAEQENDVRARLAEFLKQARTAARLRDNLQKLLAATSGI